MSTLSDRLSQLLVTDFGVPEAEVLPDATFEDMALDSLALIELTMAIKKETGVVLTDDELQIDFTLADAIALIESKGVAV